MVYTKKQFYEKVVKPYLTDDKPKNRQIYNDTLDYYIRENKVPKSAVNWTYPNTSVFLSRNEIERNKRFRSK